VFVCAVAPSGVGGNEYYPTQAEYLAAVADAMHEEYAAIIDAGFTLQIDDPFLTDMFSYGPAEEKLANARGYVDAINRGLRGIPRDRVPAAHLLRDQPGSPGTRRVTGGADRHPVHDRRRGVLLRGRQPTARARLSHVRVRCPAAGHRAAARRHQPRHEHRRAPGNYRRPDHQVCRTSGPGKRRGQRGLRLLLPSQLHPGDHPRIVWAKFEALAEGARLRTSHADRDQAIDRLKAAFVRGRLTKDELVARTAQACSARTYADLAALTADLPAEPPAAKSPSQPVVLVLGVPAATVVAVPIVVALKLEARRRNRSRGQLPPRPTPGTRTQAQRPTTQPPPIAIQPPPIAIQPPPIAIQPPPIDRDHPAAEAARPRSPSPRHPAIAYASS